MDGRRLFLKRSLMGAAAYLGTGIGSGEAASAAGQPTRETAERTGNQKRARTGFVIVSTWNHGLGANEAAARSLEEGGSVLDAAEAGVRVPEADPDSMSVGYGGLPDRDGHVTLDACIMGPDGNCGSVSFLEHIKHPISVARRVMERTPHVMLSGEGALQFALAEGFPREDLLTEKARQRWQEWLADSGYEPVGEENHDTIGLLVRDEGGNLAGACTTSGMAWKLHGRVGDSPIIGAGLYVDNAVGAATATGVGEMVIKTCGSFLVVELMRQGASPGEACVEAVERILKGQEVGRDRQVGYLALDKAGNTGACAIRPGFSYALYADGANGMHDSPYRLE